MHLKVYCGVRWCCQKSYIDVSLFLCRSMAEEERAELLYKGDAKVIPRCLAYFPTSVLVVGDMGVGKTSIIKRYVHNIFTPNYKATVWEYGKTAAAIFLYPRLGWILVWRNSIGRTMQFESSSGTLQVPTPFYFAYFWLLHSPIEWFLLAAGSQSLFNRSKKSTHWERLQWNLFSNFFEG